MLILLYNISVLGPIVKTSYIKIEKHILSNLQGIRYLIQTEQTSTKTYKTYTIYIYGHSNYANDY